MVEIGRQLLTAALAAGHFEVIWGGCAALACAVVALVAGGTRGTHRRPRPAGRTAGLTATETRVLYHLARAGQLRQNAELFRNRAMLDGVLQRGVAALRDAGAPGGSRYRHRLAVLLSIKARISARVPASIGSLAPFQEGDRVTLARAATDGIETALLAGIGDVLACPLPEAEEALPPLRAGMKVTVRPAAAGRQAGVVATVLGRAWVAGQSAVLLTRARTLAGSVRARGGRRRCRVTPVALQHPLEPAAAGAAAREPAIIGTLVSLDAKWARVRAVAPVAAGRLVKLVVELGMAARLPLYGKVVQAPRRGAAGVMLVHLTGLSRSRIRDLYRFVDEWRAAAGAGLRR